MLFRSGQDPDQPQSPIDVIPVDDLKSAQEAVKFYIEDHDLGGGNWIGGQVIDEATKEIIAMISYNRNVWQEFPRIQIKDDMLDHYIIFAQDYWLKRVLDQYRDREVEIQREISRLNQRANQLAVLFTKSQKRLGKDDPLCHHIKSEIETTLDRARQLGASDDHLHATGV